MKSKCVKCDAMQANDILVEACISYRFCQACAETLHQLPTGSVRSFLGPKYVKANIQMAKERRANGGLSDRFNTLVFK